MNIAIVHDYLGQCGGAERVVLELAGMFPDAPIYTSFYAPERTYPQFAGRVVRTSPLQGRVRPDHFRAAVLRYPKAFRHFDLGDFEAVVVSTSAFAHHVTHPRSFVYCHTPPRFLYDTTAYGISLLLASGGAPALAYLRHADRRAAAGHLAYAANSAGTAQRIARTYGRPAPVIHPPLWTSHLPIHPPPMPQRPRALVVSRLLPYKKVEVAVHACALAGIRLTIVGDGPDEARLRREGGSTVRFLGRVEDAELADLFADHSVVLVTGREDFGYIPVEANYAGRPVIALAEGGALETVVDGVTGLLVHSRDPEDWAAALREAHSRQWQPRELRRATARFHADAFRTAVREWVGVERAIDLRDGVDPREPQPPSQDHPRASISGASAWRTPTGSRY